MNGDEALKEVKGAQMLIAPSFSLAPIPTSLSLSLSLFDFHSFQSEESRQLPFSQTYRAYGDKVAMDACRCHKITSR